jgi:hypothetical protein
MVMISSSTPLGLHGSFNGQAVRARILAETAELRPPRIRAKRTAISSPLIRSLFKSTRVAFWVNRVI